MFEKFYEQAYMNGMVNKDLHDINNIPIDQNCKGNAVHRNMNISLENKQRAKVLSSAVQIKAHNAVIIEKNVYTTRNK